MYNIALDHYYNYYFVTPEEHKEDDIHNLEIPDEWYRRFTNKKGNADLTLIFILAEIVHLHNKKGNEDDILTSYNHFVNKLSLSKSTVRNKFAKLEEMRIINIGLHDIVIDNQKYNNMLFIKLFMSNLIP